jgi:MoaA/NifB/PqqE/SkfB family radical SAM enzyme
MSNGYRLDCNEIDRLVDNGATGVTVSLDSINSEEALLTRKTPSKIHQQIISNLEKICMRSRNFELGINSVVSSVTANWNTVKDILKFGSRLGIDFVKFQPIFDDGYVTANDPQLLLSSKDYHNLLYIGKHLRTTNHPKTNPSGFWKNIAHLAIGKTLSPSSCDLEQGHSIAVRNKLSICYWLDKISFGKTCSNLAIENALRVKKKFEMHKQKCNVNFQCFCTQKLGHVWKNQKE